MDSVMISDPIIIGLLSSSTVSAILLIVSIYCHRNVIISNARHPVFELRRPYFVSYMIIAISTNMFLRAILALMLYHSLISIVIFRESFRFLAIFGESMILIQRMYFIGYDLQQIKYKQTKLLSKYLQRGNDTKQALNLMNQYAQRHIDAQTSPSVPTHSTSLSRHLSLHKTKQCNMRNEDIIFDPNTARLSEKILYHNQYFGNIRVITACICLILIFVVFIPGLFIHYITNIFIFFLITSYILFVIYTSYNPCTPNYHDPSNWVHKYHCCICNRMRHNFEKEIDANPNTTYIRKQNLHLSHYDDHYLSLELTIILCILCILLVVFVIIEILKYYFYDDQMIEFYFVLLNVLIWTIAGVFIVITLIFVPLFAIKGFHKKYHRGKLKAKQCQMDLKDVLSHYTGFYSFTNQLLQDYSIENLMFLIEIWQYKYFSDTISTSFPETETHKDKSVMNKMEQTLSLGQKPPETNSNNIDPVMGIIQDKEANIGKNQHKNTNNHEEGLSMGPLFKLKINVLLNALQDTQSDVSENMDESEQLKGTPQPVPGDDDDGDDDTSVTDDDIGMHNDRDQTAETTIDDDDLEDFEASNDCDVSRKIGYSSYLHAIGTKSIDIDEYLHLLSDLPWHQLPVSDSCRKYKDRYFKAVHIFNKYLSRSAFDSLNISEVALADIESTFRCLYEYKLRSYNIGIELDERERKQLKFESNPSGSTYSRNTNFDFFEEPEESSSSVNKSIPPNIDVNNRSVSVSSSMSSAPSAATQLQMVNTDSNNSNIVKEIKRKQKLRETLGLKIHFTSNTMYLHAMSAPKIQNEEEFHEKLESVFDICLSDIINNLESALTQFRSTKEYYYVLSDKLNE